MSQNGKLLTQIMNNLDKPSKVKTPDNLWQKPGQKVKINSSSITMKGVGTDAIGVDVNGFTQYMKDGYDYQFTGPVTEYPLMQKGGLPPQPSSSMIGPSTAMTSLIPKIAGLFSGDPLKKFINWVNTSGVPASKPSSNGIAGNESSLYNKAYGDWYRRQMQVIDQLNKNNSVKYADSANPLLLTSGRFRGAKVAPEMVNDIVKAAKANGVDPWLMLSLVGRESTFGSGTRSNKERTNDKQLLASGWNVAEDYLPYRLDRYLADKQVPGVSVIKDNHGWGYFTDEDRVDRYLKEHPEIIADYTKKLESTPSLGNMDSFSLAAKRIKEKGVQNYNPGDPKYTQMIQSDMKLLKSDPKIAAYMKKLGYAEGGELIRRADGSYSRRGLWDNIRANRGSGKEPTKEMLEQERKINAMKKYQDGGSKSGRMTPDREAAFTKAMNEQYFSRPEVIEMLQQQAQKKAYGKPKKLNYTDAEITKSMNEQYFMRPENRQYLKHPYVMPSYVDPYAAMMFTPPYANGGTNNPGFKALPDHVQAKILSNMAQGGEANGEMALGQMAAVSDKMSKLLKFVKPEENLDPWIASKLAVMDHSADAIYDYLTYGPQAAEQMEQMKMGGGIPQRYKNMGFTKVGVKKESTRPGKKWMVLAKKGSDYKVVHGGYDGMKDFSQHGSEKRKANFWSRMGGKNSAKAKDPFSPLYWHKKFGTWQDGGQLQDMPSPEEIIQAYADYAATSVEVIVKELKTKTEEEQQSMLMQMYQELVDADQQDLPQPMEEGQEEEEEEMPEAEAAEEEQAPVEEEEQPADDQDDKSYDVMYRRGGYIGYDGKRHQSKTPTWSGNVGYAYGGYIPEFMAGGYCYECGGGVYQQGGPLVGQEIEITDKKQLEQLRAQGYEFEII